MKRLVDSKVRKFMKYVNESRDNFPDDFKVVKEKELYVLRGSINNEDGKFVLAVNHEDVCSIIDYDLGSSYFNNDFIEEMYDDDKCTFGDIIDWVRTGEYFKNLPLYYWDILDSLYVDKEVIMQFDDTWETVPVEEDTKDLIRLLNTCRDWDELCKRTKSFPIIDNDEEFFEYNWGILTYRIYKNPSGIFISNEVKVLEETYDENTFSERYAHVGDEDIKLIGPSSYIEKFQATEEQELALENLLSALKMAKHVGLRIFVSPEIGVHPYNGNEAKLHHDPYGLNFPERDFRFDDVLDEVIESYFGDDYSLELKN